MKKLTVYTIFMLAFLPGCLDIKLESQFSDPDAITTTATAKELLASAYSSYPRYQFEFSLLSDDFYPTSFSAYDQTSLNLYKWLDRSIDELSTTVWNEYYYTVALVNALLPRLGNVTVKDETDALELRRIESEAKALKAMCYFDLLRLYGPVWSEGNADKDGIVLKDRLELDFLPRSSLKVCVQEISALLGEAASVENDAAQVFYLSTSAVKALQAELELYRGNYDEVINIALPLLADAENIWTQANYDNLWGADASPERLFAPYIFDSFYINMNYEREKGDYFMLSDDVVFAPEDMRTGWSVYHGPVEGVRSLGKYNRMYYENIEVRYINTLRYSGVCFTVAEAYARGGHPDKAIALMDRYLMARGVEKMDESLVGDPLVEAILAEKQKEFVGEGTRLFDLKRLGKPLRRHEVNGAVGTKVSATDYRWLFPIPQSEYRYNDKMTQNPDWPKLMVD